jgi:hypothetical protein
MYNFSAAKLLADNTMFEGALVEKESQDFLPKDSR